MNIDEISLNEKYKILMHGIMNKNITHTCKMYGISRTIYYRWLKRYQLSGIEGLKNIKKKSPKMPNEVPKYIEKEILKIVKENPILGPRRIYEKMKEDGFLVGESGIYNVLRRNKLNKYIRRLELSNVKSDFLKDEAYNSIKNLLCHPENFYPGYILIQSTSYIGKFNNIGRVYQMIAIDYFSKFAFVKIYTNKKAINSKDLLETRVIPTAKHFDIKIKNIITNKSSEFTTGWEMGRHKYEEFLKANNIAHFYMKKIIDNDLYNIVKKFQELIYKNLYFDLIKNTIALTFDELEDEINNYLKKYNFLMTLDEGVNKGKTPMEVVTKDKEANFPIPLWLLVDGITIK